MKALRLIIEGRVQGVGYRAWAAREARMRSLSGFVRNRGDGSVEAVICGDDAVLADMLAACRKGPRMAVVTDIVSEEIPLEPWAGFEQRPTV